MDHNAIAHMRFHFIAIGGSVMHNLALALHQMGHQVSGSDDEIYEPAKSRLSAKGILPSYSGWNPDAITPELDAVILGMHAKLDNPELKRAETLGVKVYSFPDFIYQQSQNKQRVVVAGSHGKTTITSMILHVLKHCGRKFDYLVGAQIEGFDTMVQITDDAPVLIVEGDEYLTSPTDRRPKFMAYHAHIAVISGIAWDHMNVFPTEADYNRQFELLVQSLPKAGVLIYQEEDKTLRQIVKRHARDEEHYLHPYSTPDFKIVDNQFELRLKGKKSLVSVIGRHNLANIAAAWEVCRELAVDIDDFMRHIATFKGAAKRLEKIYDDGKNVVFRDFAHAPSKVKATVEAVKELYGKQNVVAVLELHTFSSLNKAFLHQYHRSLRPIKNKLVFVNQHTLDTKGYPAISKQELIQAFDDPSLEYATTAEQLQAWVKAQRQTSGNVFLFMSSGPFADLDLKNLAIG